MAVPALALSLAAANSGGFTYRMSDGTVPTHGFAVSPYKAFERRITCPKLEPDVIDAYVHDNRHVIGILNIEHYGQVCLGAWHHDGSWYLDLSVVVPSLDQALRIARHHDQLAVYSLEDHTEIPVAYDHG